MADRIIDPNIIEIVGEGVPGPAGGMFGDAFPVSRYADLATAVAAAVDAGGGTVVIDQDTGLYTRLTIPQGVSVSGVGGAVLYVSAGGLDIGEPGVATTHPPFRDLIISGVKKAADPLRIYRAVNTVFDSMDIYSTAAGGADCYLAESQNNSFVACRFRGDSSATITSHNLIIDSFALNNRFIDCNFFNAVVSNILIQDEVPASIQAPYNNAWIGGMIESKGANPTLAIHITAGTRNQFIGTQTAVGGVLIDGTRTKRENLFRAMQFYATNQTAAIRVEGPISNLKIGDCWFRDGTAHALKVTDAAADIDWLPGNTIDTSVPFWDPTSTVTPPTVVKGAKTTLVGSVWTLGGVDADTVDGKHATDFISSASPTFTGTSTFNGPIVSKVQTEWNNTAAPVDKRTIRSLLDTLGELVFTRRNDDGTFQSEVLRITVDGKLQVPAPTGANQAFRTTSAPDLLVGNTGAPQQSTGWRDLKPLLVNGWTANNLWIRRRGGSVEILCDNLDGTAATSFIFIPSASVPAVWRPSINQAQIMTRTVAGNFVSPPTGNMGISTTGNISAPQGTGATYFGKFTYEVITAWPTTHLAGTTEITAPGT